MTDTTRTRGQTITGALVPKYLQNKRLQYRRNSLSTIYETQSRSFQMDTLKMPNTIDHQHYFTDSKPITLMNIYLDQSFRMSLKMKMSLVKCKECGVNFISFSEQDVKSEKQRYFPVTFAAYYNTSQLGVGKNNGYNTSLK